MAFWNKKIEQVQRELSEEKELEQGSATQREGKDGTVVQADAIPEEGESIKTAGQRKMPGWQGNLVKLIALGMSIYLISGSLFGLPEPLQVRPVTLCFGMVLGFMLYPANRSGKKRQTKVPWYDWILIGLVLAVTLYTQINYEYIVNRFVGFDPVGTWDVILGFLLIVLICEAARRIVGMGMVIIAAVLIIHTLAGQYMPGVLNHPGMDPLRYIERMFLTTDGISGSIIGTASTYVFVFILFGSILQACNASKFFMDLAISATAKERGGPAKAAVVGSAFFGMMSGSSVSNVYATGAITIPLMIKTGFQRHFAGAVEACSSASGQIMPPVMGSAAFLIAEYTGRSYGEVCIASALPAFVYVLAIYFMVHFQAIRQNLPAYNKEDLPENVKRILARFWHLFVPIAMLITMLALNFTAYKSALYSTGMLLVISSLRKDTRINVKLLIDALIETAKKATPIIVAVGCASLVTGTTGITGVPYKITASIVDIAQGSLFLCCVMVSACTILLGMELPVVVSFVIGSLFGVPALMQLGVDRFTANMFVFYVAILATITPPVCMSSFAGAAIAEAPMMKTGFTACRIGCTAYILPFMLVYNPMLMYTGGNFLPHIPVFLMAAIGVVSLASGIQGQFVCESRWYERGAMIVASVLLIDQGLISDLIGLGVIAIVLILQTARAKVNPFRAIRGY